MRGDRLKRDGRFETLLLLGVAGVAALMYVAWHAPVLNSTSRTDPWFYLGFFVNFGFLFSHYSFTYYAARLPWIIVGRAAYAVFPPLAAFFVMHVAFFLGGAIALYLLLRRYYDRTVGLVVFGAIVTNVVYFVAHASDYVDGPVITLLFATLSLALPRASGRRARVSLAFAGFAFAAAIGSTLAAGPFGAGLVLVWAAVRLTRPGIVRRVIEDAVPFLIGAAALFVIVGVYSKVEGGHAFFIAPQLDALGQLHSPSYRVPGFDWLLRTPKLFVIPALLVLLAFVRPRRPWTEADRLIVGSAAYGVYLVVLAILWEHSGGSVLEQPFYFSLFTPGTFLLLGALLYRLRVSGVARGRLAVVAFAAVVVAALPNIVVYAGGPSTFLISNKGSVVVLVFAFVALVAVVIARRRPPHVVATVVAAVAVVAGSNLASAASITTKPDVAPAISGSFTARRHDMTLSLALVRYLRRSGLQNAPLAFWAQDAGTIHALLSTYLYMWPTAARQLPTVDAELRQRLPYLHPYHLILLCPGSCAEAAHAFSRAGYRTEPGPETMIGTIHLKVLNLPEYRVRGPYDAYARFYAVGQNALTLTAPRGRVVARWDLRHGPPAGWTGAAVTAMATAHGGAFETGSQEWEYELASKDISLPAGSYAAYLHGNVLFGGLDLGVLDGNTNTWLNQTLFWFRQVGYGKGWMAAQFRLAAPTPIQVILSNWIPSPRSSRWSLDELKLVRLGR